MQSADLLSARITTHIIRSGAVSQHKCTFCGQIIDGWPCLNKRDAVNCKHARDDHDAAAAARAYYYRNGGMTLDELRAKIEPKN